MDGRSSRWVEHKAERRSAIVAAAIEVIAEGEVGADVHVQLIADRAGLSRTVLYRHFADRSDLDRAIREEVLADLMSRLGPAMTLAGTPREILGRIVGEYVAWSAAHPTLHAFAEQDVPAGHSPIAATTEQIAQQLGQLLELALQVLSARIDDSTRQGFDPLMFGLVGSAMAAVRRWLSRPVLEPDADELAALLSEAVWYQLSGIAAARGLRLDPDVPLEQMITAALEAK